MGSNFQAKLDYLFRMIALAGVYFITAKLGLTLAFVQANATAVWPPTGIALASLLIWGWRIWPGVFLGAFLANFFTAGTVLTSLGIASGNSLEALVGYYLVTRLAHGREALRWSSGLYRFAFLGGVLAPMVSATVGVSTLVLAGFLGGAQFKDVWLTWWLGDMGGALLVAPPILLWPGEWPGKIQRSKRMEGAVFLVVFLIVAWVLFGGWSALSTQNYPVKFIFIPLLLWAAVSFTPFVAALAILAVSIVSIEGTIHGLGPFYGFSENQSLIFLQCYMSVMSVTILALASVVAERKRAEEGLRWSHSELQLKVFERTEELTKTNFRLEKEIGEKEKIAAELTESNEKFRLLSEATQEGVVLVEKGTIRGANSTFCRMFGYELSEVIGMRAEDFVAEEGKEKAREYIESHFEKIYTTTGLRKDGTRIDLEISGRTIPRDGWTARVTAIRDVTERNRQEEERRRLALLVETSPDFICLTSVEGKMTYLNSAGRRLAGLSLDEDVTGKLHEEFISPADVPKLRGDVIGSLLSVGHWAGEFELRHFKTGEALPLHFTAVLIKDPSTGEPRAMAAIGRDMREMKKKEEEIQRMALIVENSLDMILLSVPGGETIFFNRAGRRMLGIGEDEDLKALNPADYLFPGDLEKALNVITPTLMKEGRWEGEFRFRNPKTGDPVFLHFTSVVMKDAKTGKPNLTASIGRDITERKKIEELARSNQELEQFAYVASHDLQEPLRMIASFVQLLARSYEGKLDAEADEYIHHTVEGVKRMQALILDLLAYSRLGSASQPFAPVDCAEALRQTLLNLDASLKESGAKVAAGPLPGVNGDFNQIVQLFQNLIANAVKFHGKNPPEILVEAQARDGGWLFSVRDRGIGIDPQYAEQIFEIFKRLHNRSEYPGTGIGLAICKKVVTRHGGRIWVESQPGEGACFYWTLPALKGGG